MEAALKDFVGLAALAIEFVAVLLVVWGALEAVGTITVQIVQGAKLGWRRDAWVSLGMWLLLALQFALGADIIRSAVAPTWKDIGQLAAIALIRTFLGHFLEKDIVGATRAAEAGIEPREPGREPNREPTREPSLVRRR